MSASDTVRMVPEELARKRGTTCMQMEGLIDYDPVCRGTPYSDMSIYIDIVIYATWSSRPHLTDLYGN